METTISSPIADRTVTYQEKKKRISTLDKSHELTAVSNFTANRIHYNLNPVKKKKAMREK